MKNYKVQYKANSKSLGQVAAGDIVSLSDEEAVAHIASGLLKVVPSKRRNTADKAKKKQPKQTKQENKADVPKTEKK